MAYNNVDEAVTVPVSPVLHGYIGQLAVRGEKNKLEQARLAKEAQARQDSLSKFVGTAFNDKAHLTGTAYDPVIIRGLADEHTRIANMIRKGEVTNPAELQMIAAQGVGKIAAMSAGIKNASATIDEQVKMLGKDPSIDVNALSQLAKTKYLYDIDPKTGARTLKDPSKLDNTTDYVAQTINEHPELIANGEVALNDFIKNSNPKAIGEDRKGERGGVTIERGFKGKLPDFMEEIKDKSGFTTGIKMQTQTIAGMKNPDGTPFEVASESVYKRAVENRGMATYLSKKFKEANAVTKFPEGSEESEILKRKLLLDALESKRPGEYIPKNASSKIHELDLKEAGLARWKEGTVNAFTKAMAANQKLEGTDFAVIARGMAGDAEVLKNAELVDIGKGNYQYDVTNIVGGLKLGMNDKGDPIHAKAVYVDPSTNSMTIKDSSGKLIPYKSAAARKQLGNLSGYNGSTVDKVNAALDMHFDKDGKQLKAYTPEYRDLQIAKTADFDKKELNARKATAIKGSITAANTAFRNRDLVDGTGKITNLGLSINPFSKADPYYVTIKGKDGVSREERFPTRQAMAEFLNKKVDQSKK